MFGQLDGTGYEIIEAGLPAVFSAPRMSKALDGRALVRGPAWFGGGRYLVWSDIELHASL